VAPSAAQQAASLLQGSSRDEPVYESFILKPLVSTQSQYVAPASCGPTSAPATLPMRRVTVNTVESIPEAPEVPEAERVEFLDPNRVMFTSRAFYTMPSMPYTASRVGYELVPITRELRRQ